MPGTPSDHDLLITHSAQLANACAMIKNGHKIMDEFILKIDTRCEQRKNESILNHGDTMKTDTFWKILTILVVILMAAFGTIGFNRTVSLQNEIHIRHNAELIEKNGIMLNKILNNLLPGKLAK